MKYAFIQEHLGHFNIAAMCRVLGVSRTAYYAWRQRPVSQPKPRDEELGVLVEHILRDNHERYGSPRIHLELQLQGVRCSQKRVARLMRQRHLRACVPRRFGVTTDSNHAWPIAATAGTMRQLRASLPP